MRYSIYEENMDRLTKKLTRIANKCAKYGEPFIYEEVGEEFRDIETENGATVTRRYVIIETSGFAVVNGWKAVAKVEYEEGGNIIRNIVDVEIPERYYTMGTVCEHCKTNRLRKETYIVYNEETGEFKMVGKTCLKDFTGGLSAELVAEYIAMHDELIQGEAPYDGCGYGGRYYETDTVLKCAAEAVAKFGYVKTTEIGSTRDFVGDVLAYMRNDLLPKHMEIMRDKLEQCGFDMDRPEIEELTENAKQWVLANGDNGNYMHDLKVLLKSDYVKGKNIGYVVSAIPTYMREMEKKAAMETAERAKKNMNYVGEVGKKITVKVADWKCIASWESYYGYNKVTRIYKFVDENGNALTWKTDNYIECRKIEEITGTVKEHSEYRGEKQTVLLRVKVKYAKKEEPTAEGIAANEKAVKDIYDAIDMLGA